MILHAALLGFLAVDRGVLTYRAAPDENAVRIDLVRPPKPVTESPKSEKAQAQAAPVRPREAAAQPTPSPIAPLPMAAAPAAPGAGNSGRIGVAPHPGYLPQGTQGNIRGALRSSTFACVNADAVALNRGERERCDEHMGAIAMGAPAQRAAIDPNKRADWDYDAARAAARRRQRENQPIGQGVDTSGGPNAPPKPF